jgi:hypothetical protein
VRYPTVISRRSWWGRGTESVITPTRYVAMAGWPRAAAGAGLGQRQKEVFAVHWMNGWDWAWMTFMMVFWVVLLGAVVYAAVRLAHRPPREGKL